MELGFYVILKKEILIDFISTSKQMKNTNFSAQNIWQ